MKLSENARFILNQRYLLKNENGDVVETPTMLFRRVAKAIALVEGDYGKSKQESKQFENEIYKMMVNLEFLPNSPTLMNAGTPLGMLSACFVLPVEDDIDAIFNAIRYTAKIHKCGGGTGFSFSRLRPRDDFVKSTGGVASGPLSFMTVFDAATEVIKQGGKRRGANMGIMRIDHPDIMDFIVVKEKEGMLANFNISVAITDKFMKAVEKDGDFELVNPRSKKVCKTIRARALWNLLCLMSWKNGEPAVIFIDTINKANQTPEVGMIESTNPCGEVPLLPYESCNLGSINLSKFYKKGNGGIDMDRLRKTVRLAIRFLDNVIDANKFPIPEIKEMTQANRKIGLGVMGFADLLLQKGIKYNSLEATLLGEKLMKFIHDEGFKMSQELGKERGNFPNIGKSIFKAEPYLRNATITSVAPTGTISLIASASQGIEPIYSVVQTRHVAESLGKNLIEVNPAVRRSLELKGIWNEGLERAIIESQNKCIILPKEIKDCLVTAHQVSPDWHVKMQAAFQKYTDNSISKTVNLPTEASTYDIEQVYQLAFKLGCKGITVYRDKSRIAQLLTSGDKCVECSTLDVVPPMEELKKLVS
jgi:ribonucleoside-diphosphate reductase alpha chain